IFSEVLCRFSFASLRTRSAFASVRRVAASIFSEASCSSLPASRPMRSPFVCAQEVAASVLRDIKSIVSRSCSALELPAVLILRWSMSSVFFVIDERNDPQQDDGACDRGEQTAQRSDRNPAEPREDPAAQQAADDADDQIDEQPRAA